MLCLFRLRLLSSFDQQLSWSRITNFKKASKMKWNEMQKEERMKNVTRTYQTWACDIGKWNLIQQVLPSNDRCHLIFSFHLYHRWEWDTISTSSAYHFIILITTPNFLHTNVQQFNHLSNDKLAKRLFLSRCYRIECVQTGVKK